MLYNTVQCSTAGAEHSAIVSEVSSSVGGEGLRGNQGVSRSKISLSITALQKELENLRKSIVLGGNPWRYNTEDPSMTAKERASTATR